MLTSQLLAPADYRAHRAAIALAAERFVPGDPLPTIAYTEAEQEVWRIVSGRLAEQHDRHACREYLIGRTLLPLPADRLPQLGEVSEALAARTGFTFRPATGLVEQREFFGSLAERQFQATQFVRHPSEPMFTTEPDMIHEVVGHGVHLANSRLAELYRLVGATVRRLRTAATIDLVSRVFWFTFEYGLVLQGKRTTVLGASLLTSYGELQQYEDAEIRPFDIAAMVAQPYRIDVFQPVLFRADSFAQLEDTLHDFLTALDD